MKRYTILICSLLISMTSLFAEGIEEIRPFAAAKGELNPWDWGGEFASYDAPVDRQLRVHVSNHTIEQVYLGFNSLYQGNSYLRIKNPNGVVVYGPVQLQKFGNNRGWIPSYNAAVAGPNVVSPVGGYIPFKFNPAMNGDYIIELNPDDPNVKTVRNVRYDLFDITVVDTVNMVEKKGRLWAKLWALTTAAPTFQFWANTYVLRDDSVRYQVDYNGIFPHGFGVISNTIGITNTGNAEYDRQSRAFVYTQGNVVYYPEHKIFLNPPDTNVYPFPNSEPNAAPPTLSTDFITGCVSTGYCINLDVTREGYVLMFLDLDTVSGYQPGGRDVQITHIVSPGDNCIPWSGYDGLGDTVFTGIIDISYQYQASVIHIPIWDAENHPNGFRFFHVKRNNQRDTMALFWDDRPIGLSVDLGGCLDPNPDSCRAWTNGNGNERFMNTWTTFSTSYDTLAQFTFQYCPPDAIDDFLTVDQAETDSIDPFANDPFLPGQVDLSTFQLLNGPFNGVATWLPGSGVVEYTPDPTYVGRDSVLYSICDTSAIPVCVNAWIKINILDVNLPPVIDSINGDIPPNFPNPGPVQVTDEDDPLDICFDITDFDGDLILFSIVTPSVNGSITSLNDGDSCITYIPDPNFIGRDTIVIQVCDNGVPVQCSQVILPIRVLPKNDPPVITTIDNITVVNDTVVTSIQEDANDLYCLTITDPDLNQGGAITNLQASIPGSLVQVDPSNPSCIYYQPAPDSNGIEIIRIIYCDNGSPSLCDTAWMRINIIPINDAPIAIDDQGTVDPGDTVCVDVAFNDMDAENSLNNISIIGQPSLGSITVNGTTICYTANPAIISGIDTITYRICDGGVPVKCDTAILRIFIPAGPYPPTANDDAYVIQEDNFISCDVLDNDIDANGDPLVLTLKTQPLNGIANISSNGQFINYTPSLNFCGLDSLEYEIFDPTSLSATAWVRINVVCVPDDPIVLDPFGNSTTFLSFNVLEDDTSQICIDFIDADGDAVDVTQAIPVVLNGQISGLSDGDSCFTYIPTQDFTGQNDLFFIYCDASIPARCDTVNITIQVLPVNDPPVCVNDIDSITDNTTVSVPVLANDSDIDGTLVPGSVTIISQTSNNPLVVNSITGALNYTAPDGYSGIDTIVYQVCDNGTPLPGQCAQGTLYMYVEEKSFTINTLNAFCDNDIAKLEWAITGDNFNPGINTLTIEWIDTAGNVIQTNQNMPLNGEMNWPGMVLNGNGEPIDWPGWFLNAGQWVQGADGFEGLRPQATVVFSINPSDTVVVSYPPATPNCSANPSLPPVAVVDSFTIPNTAPSLLDVLANDSHPDQRPLTITNILNLPQNGNVSVITGQIQYTPLAGSCGIDSLRYEVCDDRVPAGCANAWVYVNVVPTDADGDGLSDIYETTTRNSDTDVLRDYLDPDSDNDGMSDAFESRRTGDDCLFNTIEYDGDGVPDWRDRDSDNDGIPDYVERAAAVTLPTNSDIDADGIDDAYDNSFGGYLEDNPIDTDGDGLQDYHDLDSDNDGLLDCEEGFANQDCPTGSDTDGDGIDDAYDPDNGGTPNVGNPVDTDNDGLPDFRDPDADNDGLLDGPDDPADNDCNGNGIPDFRDPDACNVIVPGGMSPGEDGANDLLVIDNLDNYPNNQLVILSRWGLVVYDSGDQGYQNNWDGKINVGPKSGEQLSSGVYYYVLTLDRTNPGLDPITGNIMLINRID